MSELFGSPVVSEDNMVHVPIPSRLYPHVIRFLADALSVDTINQVTPAPEQAQAGDGELPERDWTRDDVRVLKQKVHNPTIRAIFDLSSERGGELFSIRELEQFTGRKFGQVRADLAGLTRMCRREFGRKNWPIIPMWAADGQPQMSYRVSGDVLRWWREA